ncbi:hypothetical protein ACH4NF_34695 [Streptomyces sp. NPDC017248]|uniref:hypothetical protein n=1 Tax=unclassified Streptomyces TaxID=2593676 RepID=UPI00379F3DF4
MRALKILAPGTVSARGPADGGPEPAPAWLVRTWETGSDGNPARHRALAILSWWLWV